MTKSALISFVDASKLIRNVREISEDDLSINTSASVHQLNHYLKAAGAKRSINYKIRQNDFGTLKQNLYAHEASQNDILILFPWDFLGVLDWRTGVPQQPICLKSADEEVSDFFDLVSSNKNKNIFYLDAPVLPATNLKENLSSLQSQIVFMARSLGATFLNPDFFCLKSFLSNGCPFSSVGLSHIAETIVGQLLNSRPAGKKVIVTDLDFTFWHGVLGEVGSTGVEYGPKGLGYMHFIYQTYLKKLKNAGVLLCISSKNDMDLVEAAFKDNDFVVTFNDFLSVDASYGAKSSVIEELSNQINIGLSDFVFIDDNPIEIEEVNVALPKVTCVKFPQDSSGLTNFLDELHTLFPIYEVTDEDLNRTALYQKMRRSTISSSNKVGDITKFLESLCMEIYICERTADDCERAIQLINKTNQFNSNGIRISVDEVQGVLNAGGKLFTGSLKDKNGEHGEVLALLMDNNHNAMSFVMSCRVFQRQVEFVFISVLLKQIGTIKMIYKMTDRNEPFRLFLSKFFEVLDGGEYCFDSELVEGKFPNLGRLFSVRVR